MFAALVVGVVTLITQTRDVMAAELGRPVDFDEARRELGIEVTEQGLRQMAGEAAFNGAVSMVLPFGWAKQAWDALLAGDDMIGLIKLYGSLYPDNLSLKKLVAVAKSIEESEGYKQYKDSKEAFSQWLNETFIPSSEGQSVLYGRGGVEGMKVDGIDFSWLPPGAEVTYVNGETIVTLPGREEQIVFKGGEISKRITGPGVTVNSKLSPTASCRSSRWRWVENTHLWRSWRVPVVDCLAERGPASSGARCRGCAADQRADHDGGGRE